MDAPKKISLAFGAKRQDARKTLTPSSGTKRPRAALHDSDEEDVEEGKHQEVTHFDLSAGGAIDTAKVKSSKQELVIPVPRKRQRGYLPNQNDKVAESVSASTETKAKPAIAYGLNIIKKSATENEALANVQSSNGDATGFVPPTERSIDDQAMDALMGKKSDSGMVIPTRTEEETFRQGYEHAPDAPSAIDYDAVPFEDFGAAMLRGMGWKGGKSTTDRPGQNDLKKKGSVVERRPDLLGVGAKSSQSLGIELGEWGKVAKKHDKKLQKNAVPVLLKNKKTGEMLTEEELKLKIEDQQLIIDEESSRKPERSLEYRSSKSFRRDEGENSARKDRDGRRDRERDHDDRKSSYRHRSTSVDSRRRRKDVESDYDRKERRRRDRSSSAGGRKRRDDDYEKRDRDRRHRDRSSSRDERHRLRKHDDKYRDRDRKYREGEKSLRKDRSDRDYRRDRDR